jgi:adenine-specific DNA-methyltransferase
MYNLGVMGGESILVNAIPESKIPHILKYMGSKREILDFVISSINELQIKDTWFCDLFSGTSVVGASLKGQYNVHSNDIQSYSSILAKTYLSDLKSNIPFHTVEVIKNEVSNLVNEFQFQYPNLVFDYSNTNDLKSIIKLEKAQQVLIDQDFNIGFHLFTKYYSGTYWSYEQCVWIDSIRCVAEKHKDEPLYYAVMSSLISAMSYVTQSTGHYAQYRDVTAENIDDILIYRRRSIWSYFEKKFNELIINLNGTATKHYRITTLDYLDCLRVIEDGSIVYADPPYQSVHYSRFYHALETLSKYDYPAVSHKGRYREDRHQSPFCKKTTVNNAFSSLFLGVKVKKAHLVLSYSDTGLINLQQIKKLAKEVFTDQYRVTVLEKGHVHSTMGRSDEKEQDVTEYIILFKKIK